MSDRVAFFHFSFCFPSHGQLAEWALQLFSHIIMSYLSYLIKIDELNAKNAKIKNEFYKNCIICKRRTGTSFFGAVQRLQRLFSNFAPTGSAGKTSHLRKINQVVFRVPLRGLSAA
jgi:hypothetical protein